MRAGATTFNEAGAVKPRKLESSVRLENVSCNLQ